MKTTREVALEAMTGGAGGAKPWMMSFGKLRSLRRESAHINEVMSMEFEQIELDDRE